MIGLPYGEKKLWQYVKPFSSYRNVTDRLTDRHIEMLFQCRASVCWRTIKRVQFFLLTAYLYNAFFILFELRFAAYVLNEDNDDDEFLTREIVSYRRWRHFDQDIADLAVRHCHVGLWLYCVYVQAVANLSTNCNRTKSYRRMRLFRVQQLYLLLTILRSLCLKKNYAVNRLLLERVYYLYTVFRKKTPTFVFLHNS